MTINQAPAPLCRLGDIPDGQAIAVDLPGAELAADTDSAIVLRQGNAVQAYLNVCPHAGRRLDWAPGQFLITRGTLICAAHGASFTTTTGLCVGGPCRGQSLRRIPIELRDGAIWQITET